VYLRLERPEAQAAGPEGRLQAGLCTLERGGAARAVEWLEGAANLAPDDDRVMIALGRAYAAAGRRPEALARLNRAVRRGRHPFAAHLARAQLRSAMGSEEAAYGDLAAAARLCPFDATVVEQLMAGYWEE
jgi:Tfp pilus assembly protein PilF